MRTLFLYAGLALTITGCGSGRINKDVNAHQAAKNASRSERSIIVSMDTVFSSGEPYAVLKVGGVSTFAETYTFSSLTGDKCIEVMPDKGGADGSTKHKYTFFGTSQGMNAWDDFSMSTISVVETVVNENLMNATGLRAVDVGNFVRKHPRPAPFNPGLLKVKREMAGKITVQESINSGTISQSDKEIGTFRASTESNDKVQFTNSVYVVSFMNGTKCATIRIPWDKQERQKKLLMEVSTEFDGQVTNVNIDPANVDWTNDSFKQALSYLVSKGYL
ncbi:MAG: hypothetical protein JSS89_10525 [Bacteroidetes bacterium]|nr:hypothetical protein [Bacteroidota bacterium]